MCGPAQASRRSEGAALAFGLRAEGQTAWQAAMFRRVTCGVMGSRKPLPCLVTRTFHLTLDWLFRGLRSRGGGCQDNSHLVSVGGISGRNWEF